MSPEFEAGSLIIIRETPEESLKEKDIITYKPLKDDDTLLTHRIVKVNKDENDITYITRGDANNTDDPNPVHYDSILGKTLIHIT